jgi:hypothetical protein
VSKPLGDITRGTTNPNRLRRVDRWIAWWCGRALADAADPLVVDLGFGESPITTVELYSRLVKLRPDVRVVGLEIDPVRVAQAKRFEGKGLSFARGGFELAGLRPHVVRAFNVLRQYDESAVASAWSMMARHLAPNGHLVEGTSDELGRVCAWVTLRAGSTAPQTLTLAAKLSTLDSPAIFAERLPKALIHHNIPGEGIHALLSELDSAWHRAAPVGVFGARQRWIATLRSLRRPTCDGPARWRLGEVTFPWQTLLTASS